MLLVVNEIKSDGVFQTIIPKKNKNIKVIRPHLYIKNNPSGNLKVLIASLDGTQLYESEEILISTITSALEYHGYVTFNIIAALKKNQNYLLKVIGSSGYSYNDSAFCGVCGDYDLRKYTKLDNSTHKIQSPLDFEVWTLSQK